MKVAFLSLDDENNKIHFESEASRKENEIIFLDQTTPNTTIEFKIESESVTMVRTGDVNSYMEFVLNKKTKGNYQNIMGLEFDFEVLCTYFLITTNKIRLDYELILDEHTKTMHKISLLLK